MNELVAKTSLPTQSQGAWFLRAEGAVLLVGAIVLYGFQSGNWLLFALLLLVLDLSAIGYLVHSRFAALAYNLAHTLVFPVLLVGYGMLVGNSMMISLACIWCAHIGMDRLVGYDFREASSRGSTIREAYATQSK